MPAAGVETVVLGIGNLVHSDDGAGVHAVRLLQQDARVPADAIVIEGGTLGLELLPYLQNAARILLVDGIDAGQKAGTIVRMTGSDLAALKGSWSVHQLG